MLRLRVEDHPLPHPKPPKPLTLPIPWTPFRPMSPTQMRLRSEQRRAGAAIPARPAEPAPPPVDPALRPQLAAEPERESLAEWLAYLRSGGGAHRA